MPMRLVKDGLDKIIIEIDFKDLSETFQDTVIFAHKINQRFIWIDCLCIIRDHLEDCQIESVQMGEIYKYAYCNISATHAYNSSYGLFYDRNQTIQPNVKILLKDGSKQVHYYLCEDTHGLVEWRPQLLIGELGYARKGSCPHEIFTLLTPSSFGNASNFLRAKCSRGDSPQVSCYIFGHETTNRQALESYFEWQTPFWSFGRLIQYMESSPGDIHKRRPHIRARQIGCNLWASGNLGYGQ